MVALRPPSCVHAQLVSLIIRTRTGTTDRSLQGQRTAVQCVAIQRQAIMPQHESCRRVINDAAFFQGSSPFWTDVTQTDKNLTKHAAGIVVDAEPLADLPGVLKRRARRHWELKN